MGDIWAIVFAVFLLALNGYFVAVEFSLISSRRDRLDSMIAAGNKRAKRVLYASEHLSIMLAGAQFGITIASLLLGKVGEPAIAHLIEAPFEALGLPPELLHPVSFAIALLVVTMLHIILGEMVPKNIALAGPETVATFVVPLHLLFVKVTNPIMQALNWIARHTLKLVGVEQKDELDSTVSASELASMIQESRRGSDPRGRRALHPAGRSADEGRGRGEGGAGDGLFPLPRHRYQGKVDRLRPRQGRIGQPGGARRPVGYHGHPPLTGGQDWLQLRCSDAQHAAYLQPHRRGSGYKWADYRHDHAGGHHRRTRRHCPRLDP